MKIFDISVPLGKNTPVYEGDPAIEVIPTKSIAKGDSANISLLSMGTHSGTHIDAPFHFNPKGKHIDELDPKLFFGMAQVIEVDAKRGSITKGDLKKSVSKDTTKLLIKTSNSKLWSKKKFERDFVHLSLKAAEWIVESGIKLVGIDYLSIEKFKSEDHAVHKMLLENSIVVVEGLNLSKVPPDFYRLICLPLRIKGGDGSPARAILMTP